MMERDRMIVIMDVEGNIFMSILLVEKVAELYPLRNRDEVKVNGGARQTRGFQFAFLFIYDAFLMIQLLSGIQARLVI